MYFYYFKCIYGTSGDFMSVRQDRISEVIPSQKWRMNMGPILSGYGGVAI